ncbi:ATP-grasp fold amidoligase family protein [Thioalkalivibrio sp. ALgr1]|uniref:ATP-grasp fold amidoligase family protein n=1 Tax=Thioalkalivibrio sp. ALgr1 TaxID=748655 RepID=UPI00037070DC|nr:ATP-grasp fold amidoligase family protein [Thioalkalivibrio sp. ALgr1]
MKYLNRTLLAGITLWCWIRYPLPTLHTLRRARRLPCAGLPVTGNDKFFWRKIFDHDPRFVIVSDKLACKEWVAARVPELSIASVLWKGTDPRDIPDTLLRRHAVFKANHGSGTNHLIHQGHYDRRHVEQLGSRWMSQAHGRRHHEWGYFGITRQLFLEEMIAPDTGGPDELKIYTFGSRVVRLIHISGRFQDMRANVWNFDQSGEPIRSEERAAVAPPSPTQPLPPSIDEALAIARKLGQEFDHVRVDLLWDGERLWFGELTLYNQAGHFPGRLGTHKDSPLTQHWTVLDSSFFRRQLSGWRNWYRHALQRELT